MTAFSDLVVMVTVAAGAIAGTSHAAGPNANTGLPPATRHDQLLNRHTMRSWYSPAPPQSAAGRAQSTAGRQPAAGRTRARVASANGALPGRASRLSRRSSEAWVARCSYCERRAAHASLLPVQAGLLSAGAGHAEANHLGGGYSELSMIAWRQLDVAGKRSKPWSWHSTQPGGRYQ